MLGGVLVILYLIFTVLGVILYKYGTNKKMEIQKDGMNINVFINIFAIIGLLLYLISFILCIIVLKIYNLIDIMPIISAISTIGIYMGAVFILKEKVAMQKIIGICIIVIGVFLINFNF